MGAQIAAQLPKGPQWIFEVKWDGVRGLCHISDSSLTIYTRNNNRCERQYPELQVLPHYIDAEQAILDGEIVVLDAKGISKFEMIQPRIHVQDANAIAKLAQKNPVHLYVFDLLYLDGYDLRRVPLIERKRALANIVKPFPLLRMSDHFPNSGEQLLEVARCPQAHRSPRPRQAIRVAHPPRVCRDLEVAVTMLAPPRQQRQLWGFLARRPPQAQPLAPLSQPQSRRQQLERKRLLAQPPQ